MNKLVALLILSIVCIKASAAPPYSAWWDKAGNFYKEKQYDSAAYYYEQIAALKPADAAVYYNLGNTYYRLNLVGPAVLNYERALHVDPSYKEAQDNLSLTQSRITNRIQGASDIFFVSWWHSLTAGHNAGIWAVLSLLLFLVILGLLLAKRMNKIASLPPQLTGILACIWLVALVLAFSSANHRQQSNLAVVMQNDAPFLTEPGQMKNQSLVPEGTTVKWRVVRSGWIEVTLPDGRNGWMRENLLTRI